MIKTRAQETAKQLNYKLNQRNETDKECPNVLSVRLSKHGIQKLRNKRNKLRKRRTQSMHTQMTSKSAVEVLKYDLTETSLISNFDSYTFFLVSNCLYSVACKAS